MTLLRSALATSVLLPVLHCQSTLTIPTAAHSNDANGLFAVSSVDIGGRTQIVLDGSTIDADLIGRHITGLSFRRDEGTVRSLPGGVGQFSVSISPAGRSALHASEQFEQNLAASPASRVSVFQGTTVIPPSPSPVGRTVAWSNAQDTVQLVFSTSYLYSGGGLCIDITGAPLPNQAAEFWPVDAVTTPESGSVIDVGTPCGRVNGTDRYISTGVSERSLVPGSTASFWARGPANVGTALLLGGPLPSVDLGAIGLGASGCTLETTPFLALMTSYSEVPLGFQGSLTSTASVALKLPGTSGAVGVSLRAQFVDLDVPVRTSGAIDFTTAASLPTSGIATIRSTSDSSRGRVSTTWYPVLRLTTIP